MSVSILQHSNFPKMTFYLVLVTVTGDAGHVEKPPHSDLDNSATRTKFYFIPKRHEELMFQRPKKIQNKGKPDRVLLLEALRLEDEGRKLGEKFVFVLLGSLRQVVRTDLFLF